MNIAIITAEKKKIVKGLKPKKKKNILGKPIIYGPL